MTVKHKHRRVTVNDRMQRGYEYVLTELGGRNFHRDFMPQLTPQEMLRIGVFGGKYVTDCTAESPDECAREISRSQDQ